MAKDPRSIVQAIGSWLSFEILCKRYELFSERYMTYAIGQFLRERYGHHAKTEYHHPVLASTSTVGAKPKIDYVVLNDAQDSIELSVETKWYWNLDVSLEAVIRDLIRSELVVNQGPSTNAYFILAGGSDKLSSFLDSDIILGSQGSIPILAKQKGEAGKLQLNPPTRETKTAVKNAIEKFTGHKLPIEIETGNFAKFRSVAQGDDGVPVKKNAVSVYGWVIRKRPSVERFKVKETVKDET